MNCGCGCNNCGDSTPKVNGTEVTILSGTSSSVRRNGDDDASPNKGMYVVVGSAVVVAAVAFFVTRK